MAIANAENEPASVIRYANEISGLGNHLWAAIGLLNADAVNEARVELEIAAQTPEFYRRELAFDRILVDPDKRDHPLLVEFYSKLGFTPEWRSELCRKASTMPPETHISCDPTRHVERGYSPRRRTEMSTKS